MSKCINSVIIRSLAQCARGNLIKVYKYYKKESLLMLGPNLNENTQNTGVFTKGMTLQEYMARINFGGEQVEDEICSQKQQNLLGEAQLGESSFMRAPREPYEIGQVQQESHEDSIFYQEDPSAKKFQNGQTTKQTFRETTFFHQPNSPSPVPKQLMNATAYFNSSLGKHSFRIKNISNSPQKKRTQSVISGGTMTLYGRKFTKSIGKDAGKIPQLVTFYGKLKREEPVQIIQKKNSKRHFTKKSQLQLDELIRFQQRIKNNYSQKIYFQEIRIDGIKDKICQRKNKLY